MGTKNNKKYFSKRLLLLRHGQATHNPRAEEAKEKGCSREIFLDLMKEDDQYDAPLTELGRNQAINGGDKHRRLLEQIELVVSSPLSRALMTADLTIKYHDKKVAVDHFREISGLLLNAKRRPRDELKSLHPSWNFSDVSPHDELWKPEALEDEMLASERGYQGLLWVAARDENNIMVVSHGGLLRFCMDMHPKVRMNDKRETKNRRFGNCELREYEMTWQIDEVPEKCMVDRQDNIFSRRPVVTLTEISS